MKHRRIDIPIKSPVSSLCWSGETLIDWVGGNRVFDVPGGERRRETGVRWAYRFDAAVQSPSGRFAAIYERFGTKAVLLEGGEFVRELNRSYYFANEYEYPIALFNHPDGRELVAHCPEWYNRIEIDDVATGRRLTARDDRKPDDVFHSRLAVNPDHSRLLSAGWIWHPLETVASWSVAAALSDARTLDSSHSDESMLLEVSDATFMEVDRLLLSANPDGKDLWKGASPLRPGTLGVFNMLTNRLDSVVAIAETVGAMLWLGDNRVVGFYETPRVWNLQSGLAECGWPDIVTGKRSGCITGHLEPLPPLAMDPVQRRFAVASDRQITVIQFEAADA